MASPPKFAHCGGVDVPSVSVTHTHIWYRISFLDFRKTLSLIPLSINYLHAIYIFIHQDFYYTGFFSLHNITLGASMFWQPLPKSPHSIYLYCKPSFWCSVYKHSGNWETFQIISGALLTFHLSPSLCYTWNLSHI